MGCLKLTHYQNQESELRIVHSKKELTLKNSSENLRSNHQFKYNGKELQDDAVGSYHLNLYDYGARFYDPALGRFTTIDPKAELNRRWSPYNYAVDNPVQVIDPNGMGVLDNPQADGAFDDSYPVFYSNLNTDIYLLGLHLNHPGNLDPRSFEPEWQRALDDSRQGEFRLRFSMIKSANGGKSGEKKGPSLEDLKNSLPKDPRFKPPKKGTRKVKNLNGSGWGWIDKNGDVWVPTDHKGKHSPHWDKQLPNGKHVPTYLDARNYTRRVSIDPKTVKKALWVGVGASACVGAGVGVAEYWAVIIEVIVAF